METTNSFDFPFPRCLRYSLIESNSINPVLSKHDMANTEVNKTPGVCAILLVIKKHNDGHNQGSSNQNIGQAWFD